MRRAARHLLTMLLAVGLGAVCPAAAFGQAGAPSAAASVKPKADKPPAKGDATKPAASGSAAAFATAAPKSGEGALPPGHPPTGSGLPAGHPSIDDEGDEEGDAPPNPHGAAPARDPRIFQAPQDTAQDDPTLPAGTIEVTIRDAEDRPIPGAKVTLGILHSSVSRGDSSERRSGETDEGGAARFDGLSVGSDTTYRIVTSRGPANYALAPFPLGDRAGKRAVLHAYESSANIDDLAVGAQGFVFVSLREDAIQVEHLFSVYNLGAVSWMADAAFALPNGFKAFNKQDAMSDTRVEEVKGSGAAIRGTFSPGRHDISFRYQVPFENQETQTLRIELPPHVAQARVLAEASKSMGLNVKGFPTAQRTQREGKRLLVTERQAARMDGGLQTLEITLTGLPTPGAGRWIAVVLAVMALIAGFAYYGAGSDDGRLDPDAHDELVEAREALLQELATLEHAHRKGDVGPKTYARVRLALIDALGRIVSMLDAAKEEQRKRRRAARATG